MVRTTIAFVAVALLATSAFAGALGYAYTLPGESAVFVLDANAAQPVATINDATWGTAGYWSVRADVSGAGLVTPNVGINTSAIYANQTVWWSPNVPDRTGSATYTLANPIDMANGPVTAYWSARSKAADSGASAHNQILVDSNDLIPNRGAGGICTNFQWGYSPAGQFVSWATDPNARTPGEMWTARFGWRQTADIGGGKLGIYQVSSNGNNTVGSWGNFSVGSLGVELPTNLTNKWNSSYAGYVKFKIAAFATGGNTIARQISYYNDWQGTVDPNNAVSRWVPITPMTDEVSLTRVSATDTRGIINSFAFIQNGYVQGYGNISDPNNPKYPYFNGHPVDPTIEGAFVKNFVITQSKPGNTDFNRTVDAIDYNNAMNGQGATVAPSGGNVHVVYNSASGNVTLNLADSGPINSYTLQIDEFGVFTSVNTANFQHPLGGVVSQNTYTVGEVLSSGDSGAVTELNLGNILAINKAPTKANDFTSNSFFRNGGTLYGWDLQIVPEPATMSLLVLGGVAALIRRRRA